MMKKLWAVIVILFIGALSYTLLMVYAFKLHEKNQVIFSQFENYIAGGGAFPELELQQLVATQINLNAIKPWLPKQQSKRFTSDAEIIALFMFAGFEMKYFSQRKPRIQVGSEKRAVKLVKKLLTDHFSLSHTRNNGCNVLSDNLKSIILLKTQNRHIEASWAPSYQAKYEIAKTYIVLGALPVSMGSPDAEKPLCRLSATELIQQYGLQEKLDSTDVSQYFSE